MEWTMRDKASVEDYQKMIAALSRVLQERTAEGHSLAEALRALLNQQTEAVTNARAALDAYDERTVKNPHE
jgi:hypothetical protein